MRLKFQTPANYIGRTIVYRGRYWLVEGIDGTDVVLKDHARGERGRLKNHQWGQCSVYPEVEEVRIRYRRLIAVLRSVCILTATEAECLLIGYLTTGPAFMGSEAVARIGGAFNALHHTMRHRIRVRQEMKRSEYPNHQST